MTLLHCDGFDSRTAMIAGTYTFSSGVAPTYVTGRNGTGYALQGASGTNHWASFVRPIPVSTTVIVGLSVRSGGAPSYDSDLLRFWMSGVGATWLTVSTGNILLVNRPGQPLGGSSVPISTVNWQRVELKIVCSTTNGSITLRQDGATTMSVTGINTGSASVDAVDLRLAQGFGGAAWGHPVSVDDYCICNSAGTRNNDFLGDARIVTLLPAGNGAFSQLVGSDGDSVDNYQLVDESPPTTADYVGSDTAGMKDTYDYSALPAGIVPVAVQVNSYATGSQSGRAVCRGGGGALATGPDIPLVGTPQFNGAVFETDPATGAVWTAAGLNSAEFGWEAR